MNILGNQLSEKGVLTFVTVGGKRGPGMFLLAGKVEKVKELSPKWVLHCCPVPRQSFDRLYSCMNCMGCMNCIVV